MYTAQLRMSLARIACAVLVALFAAAHRLDAQSLTATITYPPDGAVNADLTVPIQWTTVANAQAYYLYVGTTVGAKNLVNTGEVQQTSLLATTLPPGQTLYARMWTEVGDVWRAVDSTFTVATPILAVLTSPANGETSADLAQPFRWTSVPGAQAYYLYVGTTVGANNLVNTGEVQQTSFNATTLPSGQALYARMWTKVAGAWRSVDSTFVGSAPVTAVITYPANGAVPADLTQPIRWTSIANAQAYYLYVGTTLGANNLVNTGEIQQTSFGATSLPPGQTLYARMWTKAGGVWRSVDSTFTAAPPPPPIATLIYPPDGDIHADLTRPITWTTVPNVQAYYLYVGTTLGAKDVVNTGELPQPQQSFLATNVPSYQTLYARMWTEVAGVWRYVDSTFVTGPPLTAKLTSPANGTTYADPFQPIRWTTVVDVQAYYLYVGTTPGGKDVVDTGEVSQTSFLPASLPAGRWLYARMWTKVAGVWRSVDSTFWTPVAVPITLSTITYPPNGALDADLSIPIQWSVVPAAQAYSLYLGTTAGAKDVAYSSETTKAFYKTGAVPIGQTLYARLWTKIAGAWRYTDSSFSAAARTSSDVTITFDGVGSAPAVFATYSESGFTMSATGGGAGGWTVQPSFGFPLPYVGFGFDFNTNLTGQVQIVAAGHATFAFKSVDLYSIGPAIPYTITGLRNSTPVFTVTDTVPRTYGNFRTVVNPHAADLIDTLILSLTNPPECLSCIDPVGLDNISLSR